MARKNDIALGVDVRWFLLDTTHPGYAAAITDCGNRHKRRWSKNILSIVLSDDGTRALVKSDSMGRDYRQGKWAEKGGTSKGVMHDIFDRSDHNRAIALLSGPEWSNTRSVEI